HVTCRAAGFLCEEKGEVRTASGPERRGRHRRGTQRTRGGSRKTIILDLDNRLCPCSLLDFLGRLFLHDRRRRKRPEAAYISHGFGQELGPPGRRCKVHRNSWSSPARLQVQPCRSHIGYEEQPGICTFD